MTTYRSIWLASIGVLGSLGVGLTLLLLPVMAVFGLLLSSAFLGSSIAWITQTEKHPCGPARLAWTGLAAGGAGMALVGLGRVLGVFVWVVASAVILFSPWVLQLAIRATHRAGHHSPKRPDKSGSADHGTGFASSVMTRHDRCLPRKVTDCSDDELVQAWQQSYAVLQEALSPSTRMAVVNLRAAYLDELELRNPRAVSSWLATTPLPASDAGRYVSRGDDPPATGTASTPS